MMVETTKFNQHFRFLSDRLDKHDMSEDNIIILTLSGSKSYGTDHPLSDTDYKGVMIRPISQSLSPFETLEQIEWKSDVASGRVSEISGKIESDEEGTLLDILKFVKLASNSNPNVLEILFTSQESLRIVSPEGAELIKNRHRFLSQRAAKTFAGYAASQLGRIKTHRAWIGKGNPQRPKRKDFGLPEEKMISGEQLGAAYKLIDSGINMFAPWIVSVSNQTREEFWRGVSSVVTVLTGDEGGWVETSEKFSENYAKSIGFDSNFIKYLDMEKKYSKAKANYEQYNGWVKNRNPSRHELEAKYGYDCKHAMHLVRLIRMAEELLTTGELNVYRRDREELLNIRNGSMTYEELIEWSEPKMKNLYEICTTGKCVIPPEPDIDFLSKLAVDLQVNFYKRVGEI